MLDSAAVLDKVVCVIVTYADRFQSLQQVIESTFRAGVNSILVVNNGASLDSASKMRNLASSDNRVHLINIDKNSGSAGGFKVGIVTALEMGAEYLLLLDDDTVPMPGSLEILGHSLSEALAQSSSGLTAVLGNRIHPGMSQNISEKAVQLKPGSFLGFHYAEIPAKIKRRIGIKPLGDSHFAANKIATGVCTYGGLMFHRNLIETIGLPREDFILYMDDYEWTYRITSGGGSILLIASAHIIDLEAQWNFGRGFRNSFEVWLLGEGDIRAYHTARNRIYFERYIQPHRTIDYMLNKFLYLMLLGIHAWKSGRKARQRLILRAINDGENGRLGIALGFPLH